MSDYDYDLFVIGGGSGGVRAARQSAAAGARVGLAESSRMGGTCVIRGCVPKKIMVFASTYRESLAEAQQYGWSVDAGDFDWSVFAPKMRAELDRLEAVYRKLLLNSDITIHDARAVLKDANTVELSTGKTVTAKTILIATGGHPVRPPLPNAELGMVSDDIFLMEELPKSILIIGGGYIACEFAFILKGMGVEVTQYYRGEQILRGFDGEARGLIAESMHEAGIELHVGTDIAAMEKDGAGIRVSATTGSERTFDKVLFATGRKPNTDGLGLEAAGVKAGVKGEVIVDEYSATSAPSIYAIGDVTDRVQLTPVAIREGMAFAQTVFRDNPTPVDHELIPSAVFTQPELGTVGLSEEDARAQEPIEVYATSFRPMRTQFIGKTDKVLMKLIVSKATRKVLGCHIVAPEAGEMIQLAGIAVKMGATKEDFDRTVAVHPTMSEEIVTMREPTRTG
ncbi:glutathione-disulfide reductase [Pelagovum pacificum]|uniref:Glutathione reductase n=1 Tax=Pelagovum pacificum TaxID=2588711 RepID=A0A5C5GF72_9RHOB|nr:glutathione-disulfide reductase [Pelagovum pacificum]QQA44168.1 glutathione-disulfide reductase [Pelagovum pacificum]TNY32707.1 glutathione-disulfide reductase [Pelagovum pacificum]